MKYFAGPWRQTVFDERLPRSSGEKWIFHLKQWDWQTKYQTAERFTCTFAWIWNRYFEHWMCYLIIYKKRFCKLTLQQRLISSSIASEVLLCTNSECLYGATRSIKKFFSPNIHPIPYLWQINWFASENLGNIWEKELKASPLSIERFEANLFFNLSVGFECFELLSGSCGILDVDQLK